MQKNKIAVESRYFLDKTPRYNLVAEEIMQTFREAKYILLWRNPLAIIASVVETFGKGKWIPHYHMVDLYEGLFRLLEFQERYRDRIHIVRFEDLLTSPQESLTNICRHLDITFNSAMLSGFPK